jgi:hypothetical protein
MECIQVFICALNAFVVMGEFLKRMLRSTEHWLHWKNLWRQNYDGEFYPENSLQRIKCKRPNNRKSLLVVNILLKQRPVRKEGPKYQYGKGCSIRWSTWSMDSKNVRIE